MPPRPDLVLANRSYLDHNTPRREGYRPVPGAGGLVAALQGVIAPWDGNAGTTWIGAGLGDFDRSWTDQDGYELIASAHGPLRHRRLFFDSDDWSAHYDSVSNSFLWPLLHLSHRALPEVAISFPAPATPRHHDWIAFRKVNQSFAEAALEERPGGACWVHDYQLGLVPAVLRARKYAGRVGFFLHTPFPDLGIAGAYLPGPARMYFREWLEGVLGADVVAVQTLDNLARLQRAAVEMCGFEAVAGGLARGGRFVRTCSIPVGVDVEEVETAVRPLKAEIAAFASGLPLVVGLERCDYTKGIPERLRAVAAAYGAGYRFAYLGLAAPTREAVPAYAGLRTAIDDAAADAAAAAGDLPFAQRYVYSPWDEVVSLLAAADVVFTSSLADGMNLVPLQAAIAQAGRPDGERARILAGREAGVASAFCSMAGDGLIAIDPFDTASTAATLGAAIERRVPGVSRVLIDRVRSQDAGAWASRFLAELEHG